MDWLTNTSSFLSKVTLPSITSTQVTTDTGVLAALRGEQVLLVDDTFTSGARAQSAASALSLAGGDVVAILPVGRVISPDFNEANKEFWDRQRAIPFDFDVCCLDTHDQDEEPW